MANLVVVLTGSSQQAGWSFTRLFAKGIHVTRDIDIFCLPAVDVEKDQCSARTS